MAFIRCTWLLTALLAASSIAAARGLAFHEPFDDVPGMQSRGAIRGANGWPALVDGVSGRAADFSGSRNVCYPLAGRLNLDAGTLQFWVRLPGTNPHGLFDIGSLGRPNSWGIFKNANHVIMEVKSAANSFTQGWSPAPLSAGDAWRHVSVVWQRDGTTTHFKVCVNGACKSAYDGRTPDSRPDPQGQFCIGWSGWYGFSQSQIDELKVFDYAKSDDEIRRDYASALDTPAIELVGARSMVVSLNGQFTDPGATASDPTDGDLTAQIVVAGSVDVSRAGTYRLSYNVTDSVGRQAVERLRLVHVVDPARDPVQRGFDFLKDVMDRCHRSFSIYSDFGSGCDHGTPSGWMAPGAEQLNLLDIDANWRSNCRSGLTCFRATVRASTPQPWVGMRWLQPDKNWSATIQNAGFDLSGATQLSFWARGERGGEAVEFVVGGTTGPHPDSVQPHLSTGVLVLSKEWRRYSIDLRGLNLSHVISPFGWLATSALTFYLDDIDFDLPRPDGKRFVNSYEVVDSDLERSLTHTAFTADNALVLLALLARGEQDDLRRAGILAETFLVALTQDRRFKDWRVRNAYSSGTLVLPWPGTTRVPGWWDASLQKWQENAFDVGTHVGNVAWPMLALLTYHEVSRDARFLEAAKQMGEWVAANARETGGYTAGYERWEPTTENPAGQTKLTYKATEHSIDLYPAFERLHRLTGDARWREQAQHARTFISSMWNEALGHFWVGTGNDGNTINTSNIALDTQTWAVLAMPDHAAYQRALAWAEQSLRVQADGFTGFDFNHIDRDAVWFEGTAQVAAALKVAGDFGKAAFYLEQLRSAQNTAQNTDGRGIVAASRDGLTTGFDWRYFSRLHTGATAWFLMAELGYNPYWNTFSKAPNPSPPGTNESQGPDDETCFVATAAYGSYLAPEVQVLRRFRDEVLLRSEPGRLLIAMYYRHSPAMAAAIASSPALRFTARVALTPIVWAVRYPWVGLALIVWAAASWAWWVMARRPRRAWPA